MEDITRILIVEDLVSDYELAQREIRKSVENCSFERVERQSEFLQALKEFQPHVILSDYQLPAFTGMEALELTQQYLPSTKLIIWTGAMSEAVAVDCVKKGASNYILKENMKRLGPAVVHALEERQLLIERDLAQAESRVREQELRTITEDMTELICRCKPDGILTYVNNVYCQYFGKSREELIGTSFISSAVADFPQKLIDYFRSLSPEHPVSTFEQYDFLSNGRKRWREWVDRGIFDENGQLVEIQSTGRDITRRKKAEEKYQIIFENSPVGIFQSTAEGKYLSANPALAHIYGFASPQEMVAQINDIAGEIYVEANDRQQFLKPLNEKGVINNFEMKNRKKDGSIFWTSTSARAVRDESGNILYYEGFLQDITQRKQAEEALKINEKRFRSLMENGLDDISLLDVDGNLLWESPSTVRNLGYSPNQFVGQNIFTIMHPDNLGWATKLFRELIQKPGSRQHQSFRLQRADGAWRWVEAIVTNMLNEPGVNAIVVNYRDISERKQAEQALRESEEKYRLLFESNPMPMWIYDLETLKFLKVNDAAVGHYGYSVEDFLEMTIKDIRPSEDVPKLLENIAVSDMKASQRVNLSGIWRHCKKDGTVILVDIISHQMEFEGRKAELVLANDVTERKKVEDALRDSESKYRTLAENSLQGIAIYQGKKIVYANPSMCQMNGYTVEELMAMPADQIIALTHPDDRVMAQERASKRMAGEPISPDFEGRILRKDGTTAWLQSFNNPIEFDGKPALLSTMIDISERKQAELEHQVLLEIMQGLANTSDLQAFLKLIHGAIARVIHAENFFVVFHRPDAGLFEEIYSADQYDPPAKPSMLEKSITSYVFRSGEPLLLTQQRFDELAEQGEIELVGTNSASWLGVPLKTTNGIIGVMAVQDYHDPNRYTQRDKNFLASIESQVALAIERKQMENAEREQRALAEALLDTAETLNSTLDYREVLDRILAVVGRVVPHDAATIMLIDGDSAHVVRSHGYETRDLNAEILGVKLALSETDNLRQILETGQTVIINDTYAYKGWKRMPITDWLRSNVGAPISIYGEVIGFILLDSETVGFFTAVHAKRLEAFANQAAIAIHNSRLLQQAQEEIRERRRAEEAFKETSELFRALFESSPEAIMIIDPRGNWPILDCNATGCAMNGYTRGELVGQSVDIFNMTLGGPTERSEYLENVRKNGILRYETTHRRKDGTIFPIEVSTSLITLNGRELVLGIDRDITERKQAEDQVRESGERLAEAQIMAKVGSWETDLETLKVIWSDETYRIFELDTNTFHASHPAFLDFVHPEDRKKVNEAFVASLDTDSSHTIEHRVITFKGKVKFVEERWRVEHDTQGRPVRAVGTCQDITERKQAEVELRASEERFRQLANNIEEVFWITDAETGREIYISPAGEKIWGHSLDYLMHEPDAFISTIFAEDKPAVLNALEKEKRGEKVEVEYRVVNSDGSLHWVWDRAFPIFGEDGRVKTLAGIAEDITERKQAETNIQRQLTELEALYENGLAVGRLLEPREIGEHIINTFARYLSWHHVAIRLLPPGTDELELIAFNQPGLSEVEKVEMERHFNQMISKTERGLSGWAVQTGIPLRTGNVHSHPQYVDTHAGIESGLYMPLKIGDRVLGVISVESDLPNAFTEQDERLLATLASQAAIAFENARLYQKIQLELAERKKAEEALRTSETHYRDLADSITDILFEVDHDLRYIHWNKASEIFSGIPAEDVIGKSIREVFGNSEDSLGREAIYRSVLLERKAEMFQTEIVPGGQNRKRILEINAYPSARGVSVVAKDVTERKRNETLLERRFELMEYTGHHDLNEMMQKTVDIISEMTGSHIGFYFFVDHDEKTLNMQICSTETMRALNVAQSEGMHLSLDQAGVWADAARQRRSVIHNDYESLTHKKGLPDGHIPISRELAVPIIRNERLVALIGVGNKESDYAKEDVEIVERFADYAWDITERKQMENQLADERVQLARRVEERTADLSRANSNLARALRVKDEFLANMSHELRTPLNAILGLSESLGEQVAGPLNEKQQKYLTTINESGHHLLSLINDILDLAKIEAGQITLDINKVDVNAVCQASLRMIKQLAQKKNQDIVLEIDDDLGLMWADERRLKQMIVNLLSNAVKFTPESGKLGLEVYGDRTGNKVTITVWDKGIGISPRDMERLFRPFVQLDSGLAREATGTGLGLALVAQMARLHGGSVNVESQPGEGSRFSIQLPWEPALASDAAMRLRNTGKFSAINPHAKNKPTILLIEDTKEVVMMITDYLEMAGFTIITAQDGVDGITQAKLSHPNLILMDIQMPRMDGFETTQKLRTDPEFKDTPIIALTALAMSNDRERCLQAGMNEYMSKPVNLKALAKMIRQFLFESKESTSP